MSEGQSEKDRIHWLFHAIGGERLNSRQLYVLLCWMFIVLVGGVYVPWRAVVTQGDTVTSIPHGYALIFWPPNVPSGAMGQGLEVDVTRLVLEFFVLSSTAVVLIHRWKTERQKESRGKG